MTERDHAVELEQRKFGKRATLRSATPIVVVCLAGLAVMLPQLLLPYAADGLDFLRHILRLIALDQQVNLGNAFPLRFPNYSHGYGLATLSYYPPLAYFLMEAAHLLGANYLLAYRVTFIIAALGAALASYYLGARLFNRKAAVAVSIAYIYNPYFLMEIWTRGAMTVTLSLAFIPLLFAAIHRVTAETGWRGYVEASLAVALLILAHPLTTLYFAPFVALWALLCLVLMGRSRRWRTLLILTASAVTGALLTSFYWLPAQLEATARRSIDLATALQDFMLLLRPIGQVVRVSLTTVFHKVDVPDFSIAVPVLVLISLIIFALTLRRRGKNEKVQFGFFVASAALSFLAMTDWAEPLWEKLTPVAYLQFPWRWHGPLALFAALIIGGSLSLAAPRRSDRWYGMAVAALLGFLVITSLTNAPDRPATIPTVGIYKLTAGDFAAPALLQEYEHTEEDWADTGGCWVWGDRLVPSTSFLSDCPRYITTMLKDAPVRSGLPAVAAQVVPTAAGPNELTAKVNSATPWQLSLHAFWIPGWTAAVDGQPVKAEPTDAIGLAGVAVPAGEHEVRLAFGATPLRRVAVWVSLLALAGWLVLAWRQHWRLAAAVTVGLLLVAGLIGGRALAAPKSPTLTPIDVNLGGKIGLEGYAFARQGETVDVRLLWLARQPMEESYKVFIHVLNDQGKLLAQTDSRPQSYAGNTNRWIPGQVTYDRFVVQLPVDVPPGHYQVRVGLYNEVDGQRLPVLDATDKAIDDQVLMGVLEVN
jgi:hypothetical protein